MIAIMPAAKSMPAVHSQTVASTTVCSAYAAGIVVKLPEHNNRPWIRLDEVPLGRAVHAFIEEGQAQ